MATRARDLLIYEGLSVVRITGFDGDPKWDGDPDPLGSANHFCYLYGMRPDDAADTDETFGIIHADYDSPPDEPWTFSVLVDSREADAVIKAAEGAGYAVDAVEPVTTPAVYGDGDGTVEILRHRDGWVVLG